VRRALLVVALSAIMVLALAMPVFAKSAASDANAEGFGPRDGANFGQCKHIGADVGPGQGQETAQWNPSYTGGPEASDEWALCGSF
jgi:hypothetical protein